MNFFCVTLHPKLQPFPKPAMSCTDNDSEGMHAPDSKPSTVWTLCHACLQANNCCKMGIAAIPGGCCSDLCLAL